MWREEGMGAGWALSAHMIRRGERVKCMHMILGRCVFQCMTETEELEPPYRSDRRLWLLLSVVRLAHQAVPRFLLPLL